MINDQMAHSYDIVIQIEKHLKSFYQIEFVIYYVLGFYQKNYKEINQHYSKKFELFFSPEEKNLMVSIESVRLDKDISVVITILEANKVNDLVEVYCSFIQEDNGVIRLRNYKVKKKKFLM